MKNLNIHRKDNEPPFVIELLGWKYHHMGIPTKEVKSREQYIPHLKMYVSGFTTSPYGIEWMRFEDDCSISELIKSVPHIAFEVGNLDEELKKYDFEIISELEIPSEGVRVAMIMHDGAPIELMEFSRDKTS